MGQPVVGFFPFFDDLAESTRLVRIAGQYRALGGRCVSLAVTGFNLPCSLSARKAGVPLVWILAGTSYAPYFRAGIATLPDNFQNRFTRLLPLLANLDLPVDEQIQAHMSRPGRHIYFAMGSSGEKDLYLRALHAPGPHRAQHHRRLHDHPGPRRDPLTRRARAPEETPPR